MQKSGNKKTKLILLGSALFALFAVLGYFAASALNTSQPEAKSTPQELSTSQDYLLIHVDDLTAKSPQLIAIWEMSVDLSDSTTIQFAPYFPSSDAKLANRLVNSFRTTKTGKLDNRFLALVDQTTQVESEGYILIDNSAAVALTEDIFVKPVVPQTVTPLTSAEIHNVLVNGQYYFDLTCKKLHKQKFTEFLSKVDWQKLLPSHFATDLSFESFTLAEEQLSANGPIENCTVLENQ